MNKIKDYIKKENKLIFISLIFGISFTVFFVFGTKAYSENIQTGISGEVLRLHILANSDDEKDQQLKIKVRDRVINSLDKELNFSGSKEETIEIIENNLNLIEKTAKDEININGYNYPVNAYVTKEYFPTKAYCDVTFPKGEYDALKIVIGEGKGKNWWCVLFPPLCFADFTCSTLPEENKSKLKGTLSPREYDLIQNYNKDNITVDLKFKLVELWQ